MVEDTYAYHLGIVSTTPSQPRRFSDWVYHMGIGMGQNWGINR